VVQRNWRSRHLDACPSSLGTASRWIPLGKMTESRSPYLSIGGVSRLDDPEFAQIDYIGRLDPLYMLDV
jgi:hypothetical protein